MKIAAVLLGIAVGALFLTALSGEMRTGASRPTAGGGVRAVAVAAVSAPETASQYIPCDVNCDGQIDTLDVHAEADIIFRGTTPCCSAAADVDQNGVIDPNDLILLQQKVNDGFPDPTNCVPVPPGASCDVSACGLPNRCPGNLSVNPPAVNAVEGQPVNAFVSGIDSEGDPLLFYLRSGPGTVNELTGAWTHTATCADIPRVDVTVEVTDSINGAGRCSTLTFPVNVAPRPVSIVNCGNITVHWAALASRQFAADGGCPPYTYFMNGGPGSVTPSGLWKYQTGCQDLGIQQVSIRLVDAVGQVTFCDFGLKTANAIPVCPSLPSQPCAVNVPVQVPLGPSVDGDGDSLVYIGVSGPAWGGFISAEWRGTRPVGDYAEYDVCLTIYDGCESTPLCCFRIPPETPTVAERDCFSSSGRATVTLDIADVNCSRGILLDLSSALLNDAIVHLDPPPYTTGVDINTELVQMELGATIPGIGQVIAREREDKPSTGKITNVMASGGDFLSGDSYFDISVEIEFADAGLRFNTGDTPLRLQAGSITSLPPLNNSYLPPPGSPSVPLYRVSPCDCPCAADPACDTVTNVLDVVGVVSSAFRGVPDTHDRTCPYARQDNNCNGLVDVIDVVQEVDCAFRGGNPAQVFCLPCSHTQIGWLCHSEHRPLVETPCPEEDCFLSTGQSTVTLNPADDECLNGITLDLSSAGFQSAVVQVDPPPYTSGVDIRTELQRLELAAFDPAFGTVIIRERGDRRSLGRIESVQADGSGNFISGHSFFDIFFEVDLPDVGMTLRTGENSLRLDAGIITQLPPLSSNYLPPSDADPVPLFDGQQQVGWLCHSRHTPTEPVPCRRPPITEDCFFSTGRATVTLNPGDMQCLSGLTLNLNSAGLEAAAVELDAPPYSIGVDITTELVRLELSAFDPLVGTVIIRERPDRVSRGKITNVQADGSGNFLSGESFFDVAVAVELPDQGLRLHTGTATIRLEAGTITSLPPLNSNYLPPPTAEPVPLYNGPQHVGWLCHNLHTPTTETPCRPTTTTERDCFASVGAVKVTLDPSDTQCANGASLVLSSSGLRTAAVARDVGPYATGTGIQTEIQRLELGAVVPGLGNVIIRERSDRKSRGTIDNVVASGGNFVSGHSFFDVFVEVDLVDQARTLHTGSTPIRLDGGTISSLPPLGTDYLPPPTEGLVPLYDNETFQHVGWLCHSLHRPTEVDTCNGACCLPDGSCIETTADACNEQGGSYQGDGTSCEPSGACCLPSGACIVTAKICCDAAGGTFKGEGTSCDPVGACCLTSGECIETTQDCCTERGGTYKGDGTKCSPQGACCLPSGVCVETTPDCCTERGGTYKGDGTTCDPKGACCLPRGECIETTPDCCQERGGTYQGDGTTCDPEGACCLPSGECIKTTEECCRLAAGNYQGDGTDCTPTGACCHTLGSCFITTKICCENAGFEYQGDGTTCDPKGACCLPDGFCLVTTEACCDQAGGQYQGDGTDCATTGACCLQDGSCIITTNECCNFASGIYMDDGTTCEPTGACCRVDGTCVVTTEACCTFTGGAYQGDGTDCEPSGECCLPNGSCIRTSEECCNAVNGNFNVNNPTCRTNPCCLPSGACIVTDPNCCEQVGGVIVGGAGDNCETNKGACCLANGNCIVTRKDCCERVGGAVFKGVGTNCGPPNPCKGACCHGDGTCTEVTQAACNGANDTFKGAGTVCANFKPTITQQPANAGACVGGTATFTIAATGTGTLHYQWKKNGVNVGTDNSTLTLGGVVAGDNGAQITCVVKDDCGDRTSSAATLTVATVTIAALARANQCDGLPPHTARDVAVTIVPALTGTGRSIHFDIIGAGGTATVTANAIRTTSGNITVTGGAQTGVGGGANLRVRARMDGAGADCATSAAFAVCAHPLPLNQTVGNAAGGGVLHFEYTWASDCGHLAHLDQVTLGEHVDYPGAAAVYTAPNPPFNTFSVPDPTVLNLPGTDGAAQDNHGTADALIAGPASNFTGTQHYRYRCLRCVPAGAAANPNVLNWGTILNGPIAIDRFVEQPGGGANPWRYRATKSGVTAIITPLPWP